MFHTFKEIISLDGMPVEIFLAPAFPISGAGAALMFQSMSWTGSWFAKVAIGLVVRAAAVLAPWTRRAR